MEIAAKNKEPPETWFREPLLVKKFNEIFGNFRQL